MKTTDSLLPLYAVMHKYGVTCSAEEFHHSVNLAFHDAESQVYDDIHSCMWNSLPQQVEFLVDDCLKIGSLSGSSLTALDIGCGTGLASELLLRTSIGGKISSLDMLDTSTEMLARARARSASWSVKPNFLNAEVASLRSRPRRYDVVIVCSVLHHIPDLPNFLSDVAAILAPGAVFLHLQDPNGDYLEDPELKSRMSDLQRHQIKIPSWMRRLSPNRVMRKIRRAVVHDKNDSYLNTVSSALMTAGVTRQPMSPEDLWRVTDIHVHDGEGISIKEMASFPWRCRLVSQRSYSFFGKMLTELPPAYRRQESTLIDQRALNGLHVAAAWAAVE